MTASVEFTRQEISIRTLASGADLRIPIFQFRGDPLGKRVYIQANIHGPEIAGCGAIYDLIGRLRTEKEINGTITLVPSINPVGLDSKINGFQVGYADLNETVVGNFNRIYQLLTTTDPTNPKGVYLPAFVQSHLDADVDSIRHDFEQALKQALHHIRQQNEGYGLRFGLKLALTIQQMTLDADYVIDLHTARHAIYHHYTFGECLDSALYFGIPYIIQLGKTFNGVLDEAVLLPWLQLHEAFVAAGRTLNFADFEREAFTPELGSSDTLKADLMQEDAERIINYLRHKGVLKGRATPYTQPAYRCHQHDYVHYNAPTGGLLLWEQSLGAIVKAGEVIANVLRPYQEFPDDPHRSGTQVPIRAVADGLLNNRAESQVVHEGLTICALMTHLEQIN